MQVGSVLQTSNPYLGVTVESHSITCVITGHRPDGLIIVKCISGTAKGKECYLSALRTISQPKEIYPGIYFAAQESSWRQLTQSEINNFSYQVRVHYNRCLQEIKNVHGPVALGGEPSIQLKILSLM
jgi:hypothetical protein